MYNVNEINRLYLTISESIIKLAIELNEQGDHIRLKTLGIDEKHIKKLNDYSNRELSQLCRFTVPFIETTINNRVLELAIKQFEQELHKESLFEQLLIHGATLSFVEEYTRLDKHEFTKRRKKLGLKNVGNPRNPTIDDGFKIDNLWAQIPENMPIVEKYLFVAQKLMIPISSIRAHHRAMGLHFSN
jgi:hypothetical protein